jgi:hypothetical protein
MAAELANTVASSQSEMEISTTPTLASVAAFAVLEDDFG